MELTNTIETLNIISGWIWGPPLIILLIGCGFYLTFRLRFIQFRGFIHALKLALSKSEKHDAHDGDINHFQALMTALAATVGTGNIVGVATAITLGGPGALFWMWVTGLVGMATKYSEAVLAVEFRVKDEDGNMAGGPMYYLSNGLKQKWLGVLFAIFASIAAFGIGNLVQANAVSSAFTSITTHWFEFSPVGTGIFLALATGLIILGGIKGIGRVTGILIPIMIVIYIFGGLAIIFMNIELVPAAFGTIFTYAFTPMAGVGGAAGVSVMMAIRFGVARGIFSNESGLGSSPIAAAAAKTNHPVDQALVSMTQTFIDTLIVCTITGLIIIMSGSWMEPGLKGLALTNSAFAWGIDGGEMIVSVSLILFAFSTIIGWYYYGERSIHFLFGKAVILPYKILWVGVVFIGAVSKLEIVWTISDIMNGLMAFPNLIALLGLSGLVAKKTSKYFDKKS